MPVAVNEVLGVVTWPSGDTSLMALDSGKFASLRSETRVKILLAMIAFLVQGCSQDVVGRLVSRNYRNACTIGQLLLATHLKNLFSGPAFLVH